NFFKDNDDLLYYIERGIDWEPLVQLTEFGYRAPGGFSSARDAVEFYREVLEMIGEFAAEEVAPVAAVIDRKGMAAEAAEGRAPAEFDAIFARIKELELYGMSLPRDLGGMNCPLLLYFLSSELFARADVSVMAHLSFHGGMAMAMLVFSMLEG